MIRGNSEGDLRQSSASQDKNSEEKYNAFNTLRVRYQVRCNFLSKLAKTIFLFSVSFFMLLIMCTKIYIEGYEGYITYFTNWSWTICALFYLGAFMGCFYWPLFQIVVFLGVWCVLGITLNVVILVSVVIYNNPNMILGIITENGGDIYAGEVLVLNCVFHPIPLVLIVAFIAIHMHEIEDTFQCCLHEPYTLPVKIRLLVFVFQVFSPVICMGLYLIFMSTSLVYGYNLFSTSSIVGVILNCALWSGIPCLFVHIRTIHPASKSSMARMSIFQAGRLLNATRDHTTGKHSLTFT